MAARRDLYTFRRMLIVLLATVVVPVVMLSAIGFVAVKNERAALEKQVVEVFRPRAEALAARLSVLETLSDAEAQRLADEMFGADGTEYRVEPVHDTRAVVAQRLAAPHDALQVSVYDPFGQSLPRRVVRNRIVYVTMITIVLAAVVTGVSMTGHAYWVNLRLSRLQTDFVSNVSHELRTPLTSIRMFVETLQMDRARDPKQVKECLDLLAGETERLSNMVERLLQWARMEAGRRTYTLEPISPLKVVDVAVNAFRAQTIGSPYNLEVIAPDHPPDVLADVDALAEALLNLLSNAFKYGGESKHIRLRVISGVQETWFEVEDDGVGISPRDKKRIFDKFYRAEQLLSRKTEGTGLGLPMVRHIVEGHKGRIDVESEPGKGSRFRVRLRNAAVPLTKPREVPA